MGPLGFPHQQSLHCHQLPRTPAGMQMELADAEAHMFLWLSQGSNDFRVQVIFIFAFRSSWLGSAFVLRRRSTLGARRFGFVKRCCPSGLALDDLRLEVTDPATTAPPSPVGWIALAEFPLQCHLKRATGST